MPFIVSCALGPLSWSDDRRDEFDAEETRGLRLALARERVIASSSPRPQWAPESPSSDEVLGREGCARACLYAFDLLHVGVDDLRGLALVECRALLREHLALARRSSTPRNGRTCSG